MSKILRTLAVPVIALAMTAAACSNNNDNSGSGSGSASGSAAGCTSDLKVGLALDVGGLGDKGFNDLAYQALQKSISDGLICEENTKLIEANSDGTNLRRERAVARRRRLQPRHRHRLRVHARASTRSRPITRTRTSASSTGTRPAAPPAVCPNDAKAIPNVIDLTFKEQEGSYLVGVAAALKAKELDCDNLGFLGGQTGSADRRSSRPASGRASPRSTRT